jgi:LytS/YehU family sensor histidine kinase
MKSNQHMITTACPLGDGRLFNSQQTRAAVSAEVRALQARMNPHFLFNALPELDRIRP